MDCGFFEPSEFWFGIQWFKISLVWNSVIACKSNLNWFFIFEIFSFHSKQNDDKRFLTLKGEVIPYIVKKQMSRRPHITETDKPLSVANVNLKSDDIFHFFSHNELDHKITETSLFNDSVNRNPFSDDLIRCYAIKPQENCFGIRVNTTLSYCAINQKVSLIYSV